jgi:hypothetical protein
MISNRLLVLPLIGVLSGDDDKPISQAKPECRFWCTINVRPLGRALRATSKQLLLFQMVGVCVWSGKGIGISDELFA